MPLWKQALLRRYMAPAGENGTDNGGTGSGDGAGEGNEGAEGEGAEGEGEGAEGEGAEGEAAEADKTKGKTKTKVSDNEAKLLKENMKRKEDLKKANDALNAANARLKEFDGLDAKELKKLVADKKTAEEGQLAAKGEWDKLKARMADEHGTVVKAKDGEITTLKDMNSKLAAHIDELTIGQSFTGSKFISEETVYTPAKMRKVYGDHVDRVDGEVVVYDKPRGAAGRTAFVDQYGRNMPFDQAIVKLVDLDADKDSILKSKVREGSGSRSSDKRAQRSEDKPVDSVSKIGSGLAELLGTGSKK